MSRDTADEVDRSAPDTGCTPARPYEELTELSVVERELAVRRGSDDNGTRTGEHRWLTDGGAQWIYP